LIAETSRPCTRFFISIRICQQASLPYIFGMAWTGETCGRCKRRRNIRFTVKPAAAWKTVVLNRWRVLCPQCFDVEAEMAGVRYTFEGLEGQSWSELPTPGDRPSRRWPHASTQPGEQLRQKHRGYRRGRSEAAPTAISHNQTA
jgi:hypothetical protein